MMKFAELADINELRGLCESFTAATGAATALLELDGTVLIATGWQDICTLFHRINPETAARCLESDTVLAGQLRNGEDYNLYKCKNGLVDVAVPVYVNDEHVANFFAGQFFLSPPDREFFIRQAEEFGFDKATYMEALSRVPVYTEDTVKNLMAFLSRIARLFGETGLARKQLEESNDNLRKKQVDLEAEIRERRKTEDALKASEEKYRRIIETANEGIWVIDPDSVTLYVNRKMGEILGYSASEMIGHKAVEFMFPEDRADHEAKVQERSHVPRGTYERRHKHHDGSERWLLVSASAIHGNDGTFEGSFAMLTDITDRKQATDALSRKNEELSAAYEKISAIEEELRHNYDELRKNQEELKVSEEKYRQIVETANEGIWSMDSDYRTVFINQKMAEMLGYTLDEMIGKKITDFMFSEDLADNDLRIQNRRNGNDEIYERRFYHKDGSIRWMRVSATAKMDSAGKFEGSFAMLVDITVRKQAVDDLNRKNEELSAAYEEMTAIEEELRHNYDELRLSQEALGQARRKLNLLNEVTFQDIQNAVFSLSAYLELSKKDLSLGKKDSYLEKELSLLRTIADNLAFARNYQDLGLKPPRWQNVNQVFLLAISHLEFQNYSRDINLKNLEIFADPLLEMSIMILAENVIRWGEKATGIRFWYAESDHGLTLFFRDNGVGIPADKKEQIFERETWKKTGLGLFLVREVLSITGITIKETGTPGEGALFEISVPEGAFRFSGT